MRLPPTMASLPAQGPRDDDVMIKLETASLMSDCRKAPPSPLSASEGGADRDPTSSVTSSTSPPLSVTSPAPSPLLSPTQHHSSPPTPPPEPEHLGHLHPRRETSGSGSGSGSDMEEDAEDAGEAGCGGKDCARHPRNCEQYLHQVHHRHHRHQKRHRLRHHHHHHHHHQHQNGARHPHPPHANLHHEAALQGVFLDAVHAGDQQRLKRLLDEDSSGVNVNVVDGDGQTALTHCCLHGNLELVQVLVRAGANPLLANRDGFSPLHIATFGGHRDIALFLINARKR